MDPLGTQLLESVLVPAGRAILAAHSEIFLVVPEVFGWLSLGQQPPLRLHMGRVWGGKSQERDRVGMPSARGGLVSRPLQPRPGLFFF